MSGYGSCTNPSLWMGDLESYMDESFIRTAFQAMGQTVCSVKFLIDKKTGLPAAYCFVNFGEIAHAKKAHQECNTRKIPNAPNKRFKLNYALIGSGYKEQASQVPGGTNDFSLHVSNLSVDVTDVQLFDYFAGRFKSVKHATVVKDGTTSRGYGFVRFHLESDVNEAIRLFNGAVGLGVKPLRVGRAVPKDTSKSNYSPYNMGGTAPYSQYYTQQQQQQQQQPSQQPQPSQQTQQPSQQEQKYSKAMQVAAQYGSGYGNYYDHYKTPKSFSKTKVVNGAGDATTAEDEDEDPLEDPEVTVDVKKANRLILDRSEELYQAMEASRWKFVDTVNMTFDDLCKA